MINVYSKEYCESAVSEYIEEIEEQKTNILKNFNDMDFENSDVRKDFEGIVNHILRNCDKLIQDIQSLKSFK